MLHNKFQQQIIMHANEPAPWRETRHKGTTTGAKQYKTDLYTLYDVFTNSPIV
jgi:hypothetical protein